MNPQQQKSYKKCTEVLNDAYIGSIAKGINRRSPTPYWWNATINEKRTACIQTRRKLTRIAKTPNVGNEEKQRLKDLYRIQKKELRKLINESKRKHWKSLCKELEDDIWGAGYKIAMRELKNVAPCDLSVDFKKSVIQELFPANNNCTREPRTVEHRATCRSILRNP
ncbi:hypothetical protein QE152_g36567 [Popillia japonica]|uniref:Reverse transcriptase n=1 Tax=Popillia japonica TaxID=7064 RepID=A0AAW1ICS1_POPJA